MWDGFNKRKFPRLSLRCEISIHPEDQTTALKTVTENVGAGGVCVILDQALERFSRCRVRLELEGDHPEIACMGKVVWMVPTQESAAAKKRFDTGIEFMNLEAVDREKLRKFVESRVPSEA